MKCHNLDQFTEDSHSKRTICYICGQGFHNKGSCQLHQIKIHKVSWVEIFSHANKRFTFRAFKCIDLVE